MTTKIKIDSRNTPRAARLLEAARAQSSAKPSGLAATTDVAPDSEPRPLTLRKPDRTIRFPKAENALRQHAAEAQAAAPAMSRIKVNLKRLPAVQAPAEPLSEPPERDATPSPQTRYTATAGRGALGAVAERGVVAAIPTAAQLGRLVRLRRADLGLSQAELAQRSDVGRRFVAELEAGKPSLELERTLNVCGALDIHLFAVVQHDG